MCSLTNCKKCLKFRQNWNDGIKCTQCQSGYHLYLSTTPGKYICDLKSTLENIGYFESVVATDGTGEMLLCPYFSSISCTKCESLSGTASCYSCPASNLRYSTAGSSVIDSCIAPSLYLTQGFADNFNRGYYTEDSAALIAAGRALAKKCPSPCKLCSFVQSRVSCDSCFANFLRFSTANDGVYDKCIDQKYLYEPSSENTYDNVKFHGLYTTGSNSQITGGTAIALKCGIKCRTCESTPKLCTSCFNLRPIFR